MLKDKSKPRKAPAGAGYRRSPVLAQAEKLLSEIAGLAARLAPIQDRAQAEIAAVTARYPAIQEIGYQLAVLDKELKDLLKTERGEIFTGRDRVRIESGILLFGREPKVSIPRGALEKIKEAGWGSEAVKIKESIDRPVVEAWPDERLAVIGAARRALEVFSYELTEAEKC